MDVVYVDSRNRDSGSPSDFTWTLRDQIRGHEMMHVQCRQLRLVNSLWTVEQDNCMIYFQTGSASEPLIAVRLELGFYSAIELAQHLAQRLSPFGISVDYISTSNSLRLHHGTFLKIWSDAEIAAVAKADWTGPEFTSPTTPYSFNDVLANPWGAIISDTEYIVVYVCVSRFTELYLTCSQLSSNRCHGIRRENDVLARIDIDGGMGSILKGETADDVSMHIGTQNFSHATFNFKLVTRDGTPVTVHHDSLCFVLVFS